MFIYSRGQGKSVEIRDENRQTRTSPVLFLSLHHRFHNLVVFRFVVFGVVPTTLGGRNGGQPVWFPFLSPPKGDDERSRSFKHREISKLLLPIIEDSPLVIRGTPEGLYYRSRCTKITNVKLSKINREECDIQIPVKGTVNGFERVRQQRSSRIGSHRVIPSPRLTCLVI